MHRFGSRLLLFLVVGSGAIKVWGPGLDPVQNVLPCRYFFVQLEDKNNSVPDRLDVTVSGSNKGTECRSRTEIFDRSDGLFIVRYKVFHDCSEVKIRIFLNGILALDPIVAQGTVQPDYCNCPKGTLKEWIDKQQCKVNLRQIDLDLNKFKGGVKFSHQLERAKKLFNMPGAHAWCHYVIKDNRLYRQCYGEHVGFSMFWDATFTWFMRKSQLPDLEMMVNLGDWPLIKKKHKGIPMFSWCGSRDTEDMLFPTYDLTEASLECMGRQSLDVLSAMGKNSPRWEDKEEKVFWRGRDSRRERLDLVALGFNNPHLINASITNFFFFRDEMEKYGGRTKSVSFFDFFNYKYQLNIDGTVAAYRFPFLLSGNSVVLKQDSGYFEHFYADLKPWVHYVPIKADLSDLLEKVNWLKENDAKAQKISVNSQQFVLDHLLPHHVLCYHAELLQKWSELLLEPVKVAEGMEEVTVTQNDRFPPCSCSRKKSKKDEL